MWDQVSSVSTLHRVSSERIELFMLYHDISAASMVPCPLLTSHVLTVLCPCDLQTRKTSYHPISTSITSAMSCYMLWFGFIEAASSIACIWPQLIIHIVPLSRLSCSRYCCLYLFLPMSLPVVCRDVSRRGEAGYCPPCLQQLPTTPARL